MTRRLPFAIVFLGVIACATGKSLEQPSDSVDAGSGAASGAGGGQGATSGAGGASAGGGSAGGAAGASGGGVTGAGGAAGTSGSLDGGGVDASSDASVGGSGGASGGDGGAVIPLVCRPGWKVCNGSCVAESPDNGCGAAACVPCSGASSTNGFADCSNDACFLTCFDGYSKSGLTCVTTATGTCADGVAGQFETDVDCGGQDCPGCPTGSACNFGADCQSGSCVGGSCAAASCSDGLANARESDVDCGGNCGATCLPGDACNTDADCALGPCESGVCGCEPLACDIYFDGQCGSFDDECGGTADCTCAGGDVCNGGLCCTPASQCAAGAACGTAGDGCGGTVSCGAGCSGGESCVQTTCVAIPAYPYTPSTFDPAALDPTTVNLTTTLDCGVSTFDSATLAFTNWCGQPTPTPVVVTQSGGPDVVVLPLLDFDVASGSSLDIIGDRPVVLAVFGDATIDGQIDAGASGATPGPGGNVSCSTGAGTNGGNDTSSSDGAAGGGGGGFGTAGAASGGGDAPASVAGGGTEGTATLVPLRGGCNGGNGGNGHNGSGAPGGAGGGAVQLSVAGTLTINGAIGAGGGGGQIGDDDEDGGGGGGSGGGVLIEANALTLGASAWVTANGGGGASGNNSSSADGNVGADGALAGDAQALGGADPPGDAGPGGNGASRLGAAGRGGDATGSSQTGGGGGGGGGMGRIRINAATCALGTAGVSGVVSAPTCGHCFNGTKDADELSQDCGGADCAACAPPQASCTTSTNAGRQYFMCSSAQSWTSARDLCAGVGFALATVSDAAENTFLDGALSGSYWIGFNDQATEGTFVWVSGEASAYTNWNTGEPNDSGGEDCTQLNDGGLWNDLACSTALPYVCEQL